MHRVDLMSLRCTAIALLAVIACGCGASHKPAASAADNRSNI
jgi:hypothetical protein